MKKHLDRSLDGHIKEIVYDGVHNHPQPYSTRESTSQAIQASSHGIFDLSLPTMSNPKAESVTMHKTYLTLIREDAFEQNFPIIDLGGAEDESDHEAKICDQNAAS
ncbi:unnamed protein product [Prunus armeniaca]|uniref:WRKY domain-containing protein n=1 Tax=Prunus armeniaca TaxID=36596 RepID=A0A6J5XCL9_PRUAR|nr:unnamed protein product [Prunus armeniaca]